jgi:putative membrane protein
MQRLLNRGHFEEPRSLSYLEWIGCKVKMFDKVLLYHPESECYFYGNNLGIKLADVPLTIGLNWVMLSYSSMSIVGLLSDKFNTLKHQFIAPLVGAFLMVFADFWIEQLCQRLDFWYWKGNVVPVQNYTAWFLFSFAFNFLFVRLQLQSKNIVAVWLYALQLLFFIGLNVFLN